MKKTSTFKNNSAAVKSWTKRADWENWINLILGAWVVSLPWTAGYGFAPFQVNVVSWNFVIVGAVVMVMSILALRKASPYAEWLNLIAGIWLFFSPWFLLYEDNSPWYVFYNDSNPLLWNSVITGALITLFSALTIPVVERVVYRKQRLSHHH